MIYHLAKDPDSYQRLFYQQIGLKHRDAKAPQNDWSDEAIGSIYTYGRSVGKVNSSSSRS